MKPIREIDGRAIPFGLKNCDTDVIIPAHFLKVITRDGLGKNAFESIRSQPGNVFDDPEYSPLSLSMMMYFTLSIYLCTITPKE